MTGTQRQRPSHNARVLSFLARTVPEVVLTRCLAEVFGTTRSRIRIVERELNDELSTFPTEIVTLRITGGPLTRVFLKHGAEVPDSHYGPHEDVGYEARVYRDLLAPIGATVPRLHGFWEDEERGHRCLVIDFLEGASRLGKDGDMSRVQAAAGWIGHFHRLTEEWVGTSPLGFLRREREDEARRWPERVRGFARQVGTSAPWLEDLLDVYEELIGILFAPPQVVVHGEFYAPNILTRRGRIEPVDWESASIGPGETDLAALTWRWPQRIVERSDREYAASRWPLGKPGDWSQRLRVARLNEAVRQLGRRPERMRAKAEPYFRMLRATAERLGVLTGASS